MNKSGIDTRFTSWLLCGVSLVFVVMPLHPALTVWLASALGHFDLLRIWKELLLLVLGLSTIWLASRSGLLRPVLKHSLIRIVVLYTLLTVFLGILALYDHRLTRNAFIYALISNLRFFGIFIIAVLLGKESFVQVHWKKVILIPAAIVIAFGLLQQFVLPADWLKHIGYGPATIATHQTVDQKPEYVRIQSTLRGANPLGVYLSFILLALVSFFVKAKSSRWGWLGAITACVIVLGGTYSRSAWLGSLAGLILLLWLQVRSPKLRKKLTLISILVFVLALGGAWAYRNSSVIKNTLLHTDNSSQAPESSNSVRREALLDGTRDIVREPFGRGPGTAGPASVRNSGHSPRIAENYFIQIGQEVGIIGLGLFVALYVLVARMLWRQREDQLSVVLLVSLVAITVANMVSHAWADDTIALIWWGLTGFTLSRAILPTSKSINATNVSK